MKPLTAKQILIISICSAVLIWLAQNAVVAEEGAEVAKTAKEDFERRLGRSVVTSEKAIDYIQSPEELPFNKR